MLLGKGIMVVFWEKFARIWTQLLELLQYKRAGLIQHIPSDQLEHLPREEKQFIPGIVTLSGC